MALITTSKNAGSGAACREKKKSAKGVDTRGTTGTTESIIMLVDKESTSEVSEASKELPKKLADVLLFCLAWSSQCKKRKAP